MMCQRCGKKSHQTDECPRQGYDMTCTDCGNTYFVSRKSWADREPSKREECPACLGKMVSSVEGCVELAAEADG